MKVYVHKDGKQYGPYPVEQLRQFVQQGKFTVKDLACHDGQNWVKIAEVPGLEKPAGAKVHGRPTTKVKGTRIKVSRPYVRLAHQHSGLDDQGGGLGLMFWSLIRLRPIGFWVGLFKTIIALLNRSEERRQFRASVEALKEGRMVEEEGGVDANREEGNFLVECRQCGEGILRNVESCTNCGEPRPVG